MVRRYFLYAAAAIVLPALAIAETTTTTAAPIQLTRTFVFLPIGVAPTETAQVNVVNTAVAPTSSTTAPSCSGTISFLNASGAVIGTATKFTAAAGQIVSATLPYGSAGVAGSARAEIRAEIQLTTTTPTANTPIPACSLSYSLETYDTTTGATHAYVPGTGTLSPIYFFGALGPIKE